MSDQLDRWVLLWAQGTACCEIITSTQAVALLTELDLLKASAETSREERKAKMKAFTRRFINKGFSFWAVAKGIDEILDKTDSPFFPDIGDLCDTVNRHNFSLKANMRYLGEYLEKTVDMMTISDQSGGA